MVKQPRGGALIRSTFLVPRSSFPFAFSFFVLVLVLATAGSASAVVSAKWIEVTYSRPMLRQRANIFGTGAEYGVARPT